MKPDNLQALYQDHHSEICRRTEKALQKTNHDTLIIYSGMQEYFFLDDNHIPFKVNPHFKAWLPISDAPESFVIFEPGTKPVLVLFKPIDYWFKITPFESDFWTGYFDVRVLDTVAAVYEQLPAKDRIAFIGPGPERFKDKLNADFNPTELISRLDYARACKTDYEVACIRESSRLAVDGHIAAERAFREGATEFDIHLAYLRASQQTEEQLPYGNIIALNENAAVLHYHHMSNDLPDQVHSFLIDAGATYNGYASDITRTYSSTQNEFQELINAMDAAQQAICDDVKPGVDYKDLHISANQRIAQLLTDFNLVNLSAEAIVETGISTSFFPHGLGHYLGLQVHDVGGFQASEEGGVIPRPDGHPYLRLTRKLEVGHVITIEPGLYFIEPLLAALSKSEHAKHIDWNKVDSFRCYGGIRVEDDVVVTASGHENITRPLFNGGLVTA
ncbi:MAG: Xaa-Pro dipeptidase [Gammaproteobacteria bacterium]